MSCIGSFLNAFSKWIDYHLPRLVRYTPTYVKDSNQIIQELKTLNLLPPQSKLFTCDAVSLYTCKYILPKWKYHIHFLRCFIDDKSGVWLGSTVDFELFQQDLNSYCQLKWTSDGL